MTNSKFSLSGVSNGKGWLKLTSSASGFGGTAAWAGDFNCDGRSGDIIVCANNGPCYVFFSGYFNNSVIVDTSILNGTNGCELVGPTNADFGGALALAGNITGNGCSSIMIAAYGISTVYVIFPMRYPPAIFNVSNVNASTGLIFVGIPDTALGAALAGEGDVDGDGELDIALTTSASVPSPSYVVLGKSNFTVLARFGTVNVTSPPAGASIIKIVGPLGLGSAISIEADLNKDGYSDIAIGVNGDINAVGIAFGAANLPSMVNVSTPNGSNVSLLTSSSSSFGSSIAAVGNVNGNGYQSLLIGSFGEEAFLLNGRSSFPANFDTSSFDGVIGVILTSSIGGNFGFSGTRLGYTSSNGLNGFLVGTFSSNSTFFFDGREKWPATVDTSSLNCMTGVELDTNIDQAGCVLANIGDFNGDGVPDFIMGSCGTQNVALIVYGQSFVTCTATRTSSHFDSRSSTGTRTSTRHSTESATSSSSHIGTKAPIVTETPTHTHTATQSKTATLSQRSTLTSSPTKTERRTLTATQSSSQAVSQSGTGTGSHNFPTHTASKSRTPTATPSATLSLSFTRAESISSKSTPTDTASSRGARTATETLTATATRSTTPYVESKSFTATSSITSTKTVSEPQSSTTTITPFVTSTSHRTGSMTRTLSNTVTAQSSASPSQGASKSFTATDSASYTQIQTRTQTRTHTDTLSHSISASATVAESRSATNTMTVTEDQSSSSTATKAFTTTKSATRVATTSHTPSQSHILSITTSATHSPHAASVSRSFSYTDTDTESNSEVSTSTPSVPSSITASQRESASFTVTESVSRTSTHTPSVANTKTPSASITATLQGKSVSGSLSYTGTHTESERVTRTLSNTPSIVRSRTASASVTPTPHRQSVSGSLSFTDTETKSNSEVRTSSPTSASPSQGASKSFTVTESVSRTATHTPSIVRSRTPSVSVTPTPHRQSVSGSLSFTDTETKSNSEVRTSSPTSASPSQGASKSFTVTESVSRTATHTPSIVHSKTASASVTPTPHRQSVSGSLSFTDTETQSNSEVRTSSPTSASPSQGASKSFTVTESVSRTATHTPSIVRSRTPSVSVTPTPHRQSVSGSLSFTDTETKSNSEASTSSPTSASPSQGASKSFTATESVSGTQSNTPSIVRSRTPSVSVTPTPHRQSVSGSLSFTDTETQSNSEVRTSSPTSASPSQGASKSFTVTESVSRTATHTPSIVHSKTASVSVTPTPHRQSVSISLSHTGTETQSNSEVRTSSPTSASPSQGASKSFTVTESVSRTATHTPSIVHSKTASVSVTPTPHRQSVSGSLSFTDTETQSNSEVRTSSPTSASPSQGASKSFTATESVSGTQSNTLSIVRSRTPSVSVTPTPYRQSVSGSLSFTDTETQSNSEVRTSSPTSASPSQGASKSFTATESVSGTQSNTLSIVRSRTPSVSVTPTPCRQSVSASLSYTATATESQSEVRTSTTTSSVTPTPHVTGSSSGSLSYPTTVTESNSGTGTSSVTMPGSASVSESASKSLTATASLSHTERITPSVTITPKDESESSSLSYTSTDKQSRTSSNTITLHSSATSSSEPSKSLTVTESESQTEIVTASEISSQSQTLTLTPSVTLTSTPTSYYTDSRSISSSSTVAESSSQTHTVTAAPSASQTTASITTSVTLSRAKTYSASPSRRISDSFTATESVSNTDAHTVSQTSSQSYGLSVTPSATSTSQRTVSSSSSGTAAESNSETHTLIATQTSSRTGSESFSSTESATQVVTVLHTQSQSAGLSMTSTSHEESVSGSLSYTGTDSRSGSRTSIPTASSSASSSRVASKSFTASMSRTSTRTPSLAHTPTPTISASTSHSASKSITESASYTTTNRPSLTHHHTPTASVTPTPHSTDSLSRSHSLSALTHTLSRSKFQTTTVRIEQTPTMTLALGNINVPALLANISIQLLSGNTSVLFSNLANLTAGGCELPSSITAIPIGNMNCGKTNDVLIQQTDAFGNINLYVVFANSGTCFNLNMTQLNGTDGFQLVGVPMPPGTHLSFASVVNATGCDGLMIGDTGALNGLGQVFMVPGSKSFPPIVNVSTLVALNGTSASPGLGASIQSVATGDGQLSIAVSTIGSTFAAPESFIVQLPQPLGGVLGLSINAPSTIGLSGFPFSGIGVLQASPQITNIGDFNHDGKQDIAYSIPTSSHNGMINAGTVIVVFSGLSSGSKLNVSALNGSQGFTINGIAAGDLFGWVVVGVGDFDGDGIDDFMVGAYGASPTAELLQAGRAFMFYGTTDPMPAVVDIVSYLKNGKAGFIFDGLNRGDNTGYALASLGNVNNATYSAVAVSAPNAAGISNARRSALSGANILSGAGAIYILCSRPSIPAEFNPDSSNGDICNIAFGTRANQGLGSSLSSAGNSSIVIGNGNGISYYVSGQAPEDVPASKASGDSTKILVILLSIAGAVAVATIVVVILKVHGVKDEKRSEINPVTDEDAYPTFSVLALPTAIESQPASENAVVSTEVRAESPVVRTASSRGPSPHRPNPLVLPHRPPVPTEHPEGIEVHVESAVLPASSASETSDLLHDPISAVACVVATCASEVLIGARSLTGDELHEGLEPVRAIARSSEVRMDVPETPRVPAFAHSETFVGVVLPPPGHAGFSASAAATNHAPMLEAPAHIEAESDVGDSVVRSETVAAPILSAPMHRHYTRTSVSVGLSAIVPLTNSEVPVAAVPPAEDASVELEVVPGLRVRAASIVRPTCLFTSEGRLIRAEKVDTGVNSAGLHGRAAASVTPHVSDDEGDMLAYLVASGHGQSAFTLANPTRALDDRRKEKRKVKGGEKPEGEQDMLAFRVGRLELLPARLEDVIARRGGRRTLSLDQIEREGSATSKASVANKDVIARRGGRRTFSVDMVDPRKGSIFDRFAPKGALSRIDEGRPAREKPSRTGVLGARASATEPDSVKEGFSIGRSSRTGKGADEWPSVKGIAEAKSGEGSTRSSRRSSVKVDIDETTQTRVRSNSIFERHERLEREQAARVAASASQTSTEPQVKSAQATERLSAGGTVVSGFPISPLVRLPPLTKPLPSSAPQPPLSPALSSSGLSSPRRSPALSPSAQPFSGSLPPSAPLPPNSQPGSPRGLRPSLFAAPISPSGSLPPSAPAPPAHSPPGSPRLQRSGSTAWGMRAVASSPRASHMPLLALSMLPAFSSAAPSPSATPRVRASTESGSPNPGPVSSPFPNPGHEPTPRGYRRIPSMVVVTAQHNPQVVAPSAPDSGSEPNPKGSDEVMLPSGGSHYEYSPTYMRAVLEALVGPKVKVPPAIRVLPNTGDRIPLTAVQSRALTLQPLIVGRYPHWALLVIANGLLYYLDTENNAPPSSLGPLIKQNVPPQTLSNNCGASLSRLVRYFMTGQWFSDRISPWLDRDTVGYVPASPAQYVVVGEWWSYKFRVSVVFYGSRVSISGSRIHYPAATNAFAIPGERDPYSVQLSASWQSTYLYIGNAVIRVVDTGIAAFEAYQVPDLEHVLSLAIKVTHLCAIASLSPLVSVTTSLAVVGYTYYAEGLGAALFQGSIALGISGLTTGLALWSPTLALVCAPVIMVVRHAMMVVGASYLAAKIHNIYQDFDKLDCNQKSIDTYHHHYSWLYNVTEMSFFMDKMIETELRDLHCLGLAGSAHENG